MRGKEPKDEVQIYTWKDATLREITDLVCSLSLMRSLTESMIVIRFANVIDVFLALKQRGSKKKRIKMKIGFHLVQTLLIL